MDMTQMDNLVSELTELEGEYRNILDRLNGNPNVLFVQFLGEEMKDVTRELGFTNMQLKELLSFLRGRQ